MITKSDHILWSGLLEGIENYPVTDVFASVSPRRNWGEDKKLQFWNEPSGSELRYPQLAAQRY